VVASIRNGMRKVRFSLLEMNRIRQSMKKAFHRLHHQRMTRPRKIKGGTSMKIQCFADDPREPDLIGEATVDLTEVLTKEKQMVCFL